MRSKKIVVRINGHFGFTPLVLSPSRSHDGMEAGRTGILFQEPNPTGSRQRDLIGLVGQHTKPRPQVWVGGKKVI